jgi:hypothetical protein
MIRLTRPGPRYVLPLLLLAAAWACRDRREPAPEPVDSTALNPERVGPVDSAESGFLQWWLPHARRTALRLAEPENAPPVATRARYALAGADTLAGGDTLLILDLIRQNATLPDSPGTFQVYAFPESEQQLRIWVPEDGPDCVQQQGALVLGDGPPRHFPLNPNCPAANLAYDIDGVAITTYYPHAAGPPWIEFSYNVQPCAPLYLFRWFADREAVELVHAIPTCSELPRA